MLEHLNDVETKPKRVVIIGAGGFVGSAAVANLIGKGVDVVSITRNQVNLLQPNAAHDLAEFIQPGDALVIISAIAPCKNSQQLVQNLQMMEPVCEVISQHTEKLSQVVYVSSDAVYADNVTLATEDSSVQPSSMHGMMHAARELMLKTAVGSTPFVILRPSVLYGLKDPHNGYGPNRFFRLSMQGENITLFGGGEEQRDHICIDDVAEIIALTLLHRSKGILNVATGLSVSFKVIADSIVKLVDTKVLVQPTERKNPITHRHFDITACRRAFPEFNYTDIQMGLANVAEKYKEMEQVKEPA